jgi:hypothetical protein
MDFIVQQNPYTQGGDMKLADDWVQDRQTWDGWGNQPRQYLYWFFPGDGGPQNLLRVAKALRIPYTYNKNGQDVTEYLLIGFEGAGGY